MNPPLSTPVDVTTLLVGLIAAFKRCEDDLKLACADAALEGDMPMSRMMSRKTEEVMVLEAKTAELAARWAEINDTDRVGSAGARKGQSAQISNHKAAPTSLRVTVAGRVIEHAKASDTFAEALELIGLPRIAALNLRISGIALVSREPTGKNRSQVCMHGWYVTTHSNTAEKKRILEEIGQRLHVPLSVVVV